MSDRAALTRAFLSNQPAAAARAIEDLPAPAAAAFLAECPAEIVAPVMIELHDETGARLLAMMGEAAAVRVLRAMPANEIAFLLRLVEAAKQEVLLDGLAKRAAGRVRDHLSYPMDRLGAWTASDMLTFDPEKSVADALARLRSAATPAEDPVFLVGAGRRYRGAASLRDLLRAQPGRRLGGLALDDLPPLYDQAPVVSVADLKIWEVHNRVPVVDRGERFVGVLTEQALRRAIDLTANKSAAAAPAGGAILHLGAGYVGALATALHFLLARRN